MFGRQTLRAAGAALLMGLTVAACDDGVGVDGEASLQVLLTDAPSDYIDSALVNIGAVELLGEGAPIVLSEDGTDDLVNLLDLQDAATVALAEADVPAGDYAQLRLIIESARVTLIEGYEFNDGSTEKDLTVPSGAQTGIKLNLAGSEGGEGSGPVTIASGETVLVLDFDVNQSFVIQGDPNAAAGINGVLFTPTIRVVAQDVAASASGTVTTALEGVSVEGLTVTAEPDDEGTLESYQTQTGTALTDADGNYTFHFLVPGSYTVTVEAPDGTVADPVSAAVDLGNAEDATGIDFALVDGGS